MLTDEVSDQNSSKMEQIVMEKSPDHKQEQLDATNQTHSKQDASESDKINCKNPTDEKFVKILQTGCKFERTRNLLEMFPPIEDELDDKSGEHMFIKGIPKPSTDNNKAVKKIITRFNSSSDSGTIETKRQIFAETRTTVTSSTLSNKRNKMLIKTFEQNNVDEVEHRRVPWASEKRIKFRISSLSRDVPTEKPDLHKEFMMEETIMLTTNHQSGTKGAKSLLHFLEKCIVKNQN